MGKEKITLYLLVCLLFPFQCAPSIAISSTVPMEQMTDTFSHPGVQTRPLSLYVQTRSSTVGLSAQTSSSKPSTDRNPYHKIYAFTLSKTQELTANKEDTLRYIIH